MFFFNIFMGLASCLMRILKAIAIGIIFLARLDNSTLPRSFEFFDPGITVFFMFCIIIIKPAFPLAENFHVNHYASYSSHNMIYSYRVESFLMYTKYKSTEVVPFKLWLIELIVLMYVMTVGITCL